MWNFLTGTHTPAIVLGIDFQEMLHGEPPGQEAKSSLQHKRCKECWNAGFWR
jgi:hypothetical protein